MAINRILTLFLILAISGLAGTQVPLFRPLNVPLPIDATPVSALGDLDGDQDLDVVGPGGIFVNDGSGVFTAAPGFPPPFSGLRTVLVDLDGDGSLDAVSISGYSIGVHLRIAGPAFTTVLLPMPSNPALPASSVRFPLNLAVGDVDGDGDADVLVGTLDRGVGWWLPSSPGPLLLFLNNGAGVFAPASASALPAVPLPGTWVGLVDFDGDGDLDALVAGGAQAGGALRLLTNKAGVFTLVPVRIWTGATPTALAVGDFNGDGRQDVALSGFVAGAPADVIILNSATGFLPEVSTPVPSLAAGMKSVRPSAASPATLVRASAYPGGLSRHSVASSGALGFATQSWPDLSFGDLAGLQGTFDGCGVGDLDGDLDEDLVVAGPNFGALLMNDGLGGFVRVGGPVSGALLSPEIASVAGDVDGDGFVDLIGLHDGFPPLAIDVALNDGDGNFSAGPSSAPVLALGWAYDKLLVAFDRDGDGDADLYIANRGGGSPAGLQPDFVFDNAGGAFTQVQSVGGLGQTSVIRTADFDGDGDFDLVLGRRSSNPFGNGGPVTMVYLENRGASGFAAPVTIGLVHDTFDLALGDFDGNGTIDIFQANSSVIFGPVAPVDPSVVYLNFLNGNWVAVVLPGLTGRVAAAGDLDGDGRSDLVVDGQVWLSSGGGGTFIAGGSLPTVLASAAVLVDADLDGDLDLVEAPATILRNLGGGTFGPPESSLARAISIDRVDPVVRDLDRDGDPDLLVPRTATCRNGPAVLSNLSRHVALGSVARPGRVASLDLFGPPGGGFLLFGSAAPAAIPFAPYGTVLIDPHVMPFLVPGFFAPANAATPGTVRLSITTPPNPAFVGQSVYWQAIDLSTQRLTNRVATTIYGY